MVDTACLWADIARWLGNATPDALAGNVTKPFQKETPEINTSTISPNKSVPAVSVPKLQLYLESLQTLDWCFSSYERLPQALKAGFELVIFIICTGIRNELVFD